MSANARLPPGNLGLPLLGETLALLANPFGFLADRRKRHGNVFKSRVVGQRVVFLSGLEGAEVFYDPDNVSRANAHPFPLLDLFGGANMQMFDGERHRALKTMAMTTFDHAAIGGYLPALEALVGRALARLAAAGGPVRVALELRKLVIEVICQNVLGLPPGPETDAVCADYGAVLSGMVSLPVALPGSRYARARAARDRVLARIRGVVTARRTEPRADALSRMLGAKAEGGHVFTDDEAVLEVHHIVIAGFIVYALLSEVTRRLAEDPALRARCEAEVRDHAASGPLTMESLAKLRACLAVVLEAKRYVPIVPLVFGRAKRAFACAGFEVPAGWLVYLALGVHNRDPAIYRDPDRFDPDRFGPERAEHRKHEMAFIPQGKGAHACLGLDYSTFITLSYLALLVRGYTWELPPQDMTYDWKTIPPEPRSGMQVLFRAR
ncbi:MAG TPA: cytochrome P450 [Polyangia bacterium]|nr:cytochrome P450 [Polyangia bacterium]